VTITTLTIRELPAFVASEAYQRLPVLPISPQRARSQTNNPRAHPDDVVLVLAWENNELVGYNGAVPDWFYWGNREPIRLAWLSCLWIAPTHRGKGLAKKLLHTMLDAWQNKVILTEFSPEAGHLYKRSEQFRESKPLLGFRGYLRPNLAQILPAKSPLFAATKPLLRLTDTVLSIPNGIRIKLLHASQPRLLRPILSIDEPTAEFICSLQQSELARRDRESLNWMLQQPWVLESPVPDTFAERYHFTASAKEFKITAFQLLNSEQRIVGVILLTLRDGHLKVPHAWHTDEHTATVARAIFAQAIKTGARMLTLFHPRLVEYCRQNRTPFFWEKTIRRTYFVGTGLPDLLSQQPLALQDGDGDAGFT